LALSIQHPKNKRVLTDCGGPAQKFPGAETVAADNIIQEREVELLRAIADAFDCPIPPFVSMQLDATAA
jgi:hypothetical protein